MKKLKKLTKVQKSWKSWKKFKKSWKKLKTVQKKSWKSWKKLKEVEKSQKSFKNCQCVGALRAWSSRWAARLLWSGFGSPRPPRFLRARLPSSCPSLSLHSRPIHPWQLGTLVSRSDFPSLRSTPWSFVELAQAVLRASLNDGCAALWRQSWIAPSDSGRSALSAHHSMWPPCPASAQSPCVRLQSVCRRRTRTVVGPCAIWSWSRPRWSSCPSPELISRLQLLLRWCGCACPAAQHSRTSGRSGALTLAWRPLMVHGGPLESGFSTLGMWTTLRRSCGLASDSWDSSAPIWDVRSHPAEHALPLGPTSPLATWSVGRYRVRLAPAGRLPWWRLLTCEALITWALLSRLPFYFLCFYVHIVWLLSVHGLCCDPDSVSLMSCLSLLKKFSKSFQKVWKKFV